jgi:DNA (cytosine-5)-methyltransferase 1
MAVPSQGLRLRIASLFAGAGGFDLGFRGGFSHLGVFYERLPYETVWAVDINRDSELTWRANPNYLPVQAFVCGDIRDQDPHSVPDFDILMAGFPCQPFSNAGKRLGLVNKSGTH